MFSFKVREFLNFKRHLGSLVGQTFREFRQVGTAADLLFWCKQEFKDEAALHHYIRIERRLGRFGVELNGKWEMSDVVTQLRHHQSYLSSEIIKWKWLIRLSA